MWNRKTVALIFPTFREKNSIFNSIQEFDATGYIDEILVVDNNAEKGTEEEVRRTRAKIIKESKQGYGIAVKTGIKNTKADLIIIAEPDGTFDGNDVVKLLAFSDDFDSVFGSRTHVPLIHSGSDMTFIRRVLDVLLGKLISILFLTSPLTDVGCTLRVTSRRGLNKVLRDSKSDGALFATEWLLLAAINKVRFIEIPINFRPRIGKSTLTYTFFDQAIWGIIIFLFIWKVWIFSKFER